MKQWKFLSGYVKIRISSSRPERTVNALIAEGITVHDIIRVGRGELTAYVRSRRLPEVRLISDECASRVEVLEERGVTLLMHIIRQRLSLAITLLVGMAAILYLSSRVLFIETDGCDVLTEEQVLQTLEQSGIRLGMSKHDISFEEARNTLLEMDERVSYADIRCSGVILKAVIREANSIISDDEEQTPANIYADKDCVILSIVAEDGRAMAANGQTVKRGTLLISGDITPEGSEEEILVRAKGEIIAEVTYRFAVTIQPTADRLVRSGEYSHMNRIDAGLLEIIGDIPYDDYETEFGRTRVLTPCGLPVRVTEGIAYELVMGEKELTREEMKQEAENMLNEKLKKGIPSGARLIAKETEFIMQEDGTMLAVMKIQTIESIGCSKCI